MKTVLLGDLFSIGSSKRVLKSQWRTEGIPFYRGREVTRLAKEGKVDNKLFIMPSLYNEFKDKYGVPSADDIIMTAIGTIGNSYIVNKDDRFYFKDASVLWLRKKVNLSSEFINLWLKSPLFKGQIKGDNGTTVNTLTINKLQKIKINLPSVTEQRRIVKKLNDAFEKIEKAKENTQKNLKNTQELFDNRLLGIFSNEQRQVRKLADIAEYFNGLTYSPKDVDGEGIIVLRSSNIQNDELDFSDIVRVDRTVKEKIIVQEGDILMCSRNGSKRLIGKTARIKDLKETMTFGTFMMIIRSKYNSYLSWFFKSNVFRDQMARGESTTINQITRYMLDDVLVPLPPPDERARIIKELDRLSDQTKKLQKLYQQKLDNLEELKQSLLKQAFEGKL